jgi:Ca2+-binding RTX toxin-like protein
LLYAAFGDTIREFSTTGSPLSTIPRPGQSSNDFDLDVAEVSLTVGQGTVPAGGLVVTNGEVSPQKIFGIDRAGTILGQLDLQGTLVGGSYHAARKSMMVVDYGADVIRELDPATGTLLNEFPVTPKGSPAFDVFFGDVAVSAQTGNLFIVSSTQAVVRELTADGAFVQDYEVGSLGIGGMSGVDIDPATNDAWIVTNSNGIVYRVALEAGGTSGDDNLKGTAGDDTVNLQDGDDTYSAGAGNDTVFGDAGNDRIAGGAGTDVLDGGANNDSIAGGDGGDTLKGGAGADTLSGDAATFPSRDAGHARYRLAGAPDSLLGGGGADKLIGGFGLDELIGGAGRDVCHVDSRREKREAESCEVIRFRRAHS